MKTYTHATSSYNDRRYGRPYIARCDAAAKVEQWGNWIGTPGCAGELQIAVSNAPVILMRGQKDSRNPRNSAPLYALCVAGEIVGFWTDSKIEVVRALRAALQTQ